MDAVNNISYDLHIISKSVNLHQEKFNYIFVFLSIQLINKLQTNDSVVSVLGGGLPGQDDLPPSGNILEQTKSKTLQSSVSAYTYILCR